MHDKHLMQETSLKAYDEIKKRLSKRHNEIFNALIELSKVQKDATDQEIKAHLGKFDANYVRPRRNELVNKLKLVCFSRKRKCQVTGKTSMAWRPIQRL